MRPLRQPAGLVLALLLAGQASPAVAHPHVWITGVTTFLFEDGQVVGLRHRWTFDEFFGGFVIGEHDVDHDGSFDPAETAALRQSAFDNLQELDYFTHLRIDGEAMPLREAETFQASIEDGVLVYEFTLPLPQPTDPATAELALGIYDPDYYVEVLLDEHDPVRFAGLPSGACTFAIREDSEHPIYYGMVLPLAITLACAAS